MMSKMMLLHYFLLLSALCPLTAAYPFSRHQIIEKTLDGCPCEILLGGPGAQRRTSVSEDYEVIPRASYALWVENGRPSRLSAQARISRARFHWILDRRRDRCTVLKIKNRGDYNLLIYMIPGEDMDDFKLRDVTREKCELRSIEDFGESADDDECDDDDEEKEKAANSLPQSERIVNGNIVTDNSWVKYNVKITRIDRTYHEQEFCSGSLIGRSYVLTAAHCNITSNTIVHIGAHVDTDGDDLEGEIHGVDYSITHPGFHERFVRLATTGRKLFEGEMHDIQILKLKKEVSNYREKIVAINTDCRRPVPCREALVSGYGYSAPLKCDRNDVLRATYVKTLGHDECHRRLKLVRQFVTEKCIDAAPHICASHDMCGSGLCNGDSGGPLVVVDKDDKMVVQVGISSYTAGKCGERGHPDIYTRVSEYADWIMRNTDGSVVFNPPISEWKRCPQQTSDECPSGITFQDSDEGTTMAICCDHSPGCHKSCPKPKK